VRAGVRVGCVCGCVMGWMYGVSGCVWVMCECMFMIKLRCVCVCCVSVLMGLCVCGRYCVGGVWCMRDGWGAGMLGEIMYMGCCH
jgi:hypothetical protein